jgi:DNA-binding NarL/FixJ family response regulator
VSDRSKPRILVMADDEGRSSVLYSIAAAHGEPLIVRQANALRGRWQRIAAAILDASCLDGGAIEVLEQLRRERGAVPVLVLCSPHDAFTQGQARELGALCLLEPWRAEDLQAFIARAFRHETTRLAQVITRFGIANDLSPREVELLRHLFVEGVPPSAIATRMCVSRHTVAAWQRRIRHKCGAASFTDVFRLLLLHAVDGRGDGLAAACR